MVKPVLGEAAQLEHSSLLSRSVAVIGTGVLFAVIGATLLLTFMSVAVWWVESPAHAGYPRSFFFGTFLGTAIAISLIVLVAAMIVDWLRWSYRTAIVAPVPYALCLGAYSFTLDWSLTSWSDVTLWILPLLCLIIWGLFRMLHWPRRQTI
jgi:hypothetical protein